MPRDNISVHDTLEVYLKDGDGKQYFYGITTKGEIAQKLKQEMLKGGIGNNVVGVVQSEKELTFKVTTLLQNDSLYEILSGSTFATGTSTVRATEQCTLTSGKLTIKGTPKSTTAIAIDSTGKQTSGTLATNVLTITGGTEGSIYTVLYDTDKSSVDILTLDGNTFPKNYYVELHTIAYDVNTNKVVADLYWQFDKALPNGQFTAQYEAGKGNGQEVEFTAMTPVGSTVYGRYVASYRA